jgi:hypothetical protein
MAFNALIDPFVVRGPNKAIADNLFHEQRDIHDADDALASALRQEDLYAHLRAAPAKVGDLLSAPLGSSIIGGGHVLKDVKGMGKVYDWRTSPWTPANGGSIKPLAFVHHIPVVPNSVGIGDFVTLRNVLVAQGLMVQTATDREGNVALFTPFNRLCYQAKGANQITCGCEHMHLTTGEAWTKHQLRASAWLVNQALEKHGIPATAWASLGSGKGFVTVKRRGQTTHESVSAHAGFHDRTDPGHGYDKEYVDHCVHYYRKHHHFEGA